ncbi:MAG: hypothetical protein OCD01_05110 [Fibrobacterales bacterium]
MTKNNKETKTIESITPETSATVNPINYEVIYNEDLDLIKNTKIEKYCKPGMKMDIYLEEAEGYYEILMRRFDEMSTEGFKQETADLLYRRIASARIAQANMNTKEGAEPNEESWPHIFAEAKKLRTRLLSRVKFVCANDANRKEIVRKISDGSRISDTIQDLFDLGRIGKQMISELAEVKVTVQELDRAIELGSVLGRKHKSSTIDGTTYSEPRIIRDTAVTLLEESIKYLRTWTEMVYIEDRETKSQFYSKQLRLKAQAQAQAQKSKTIIPEDLLEVSMPEEEVDTLIPKHTHSESDTDIDTNTEEASDAA